MRVSEHWLQRLAFLFLLPLIYCPKFLVPILSLFFVRVSRLLGSKEFVVLRKNISLIFGLPTDRGFGRQFVDQVGCHQVESAIETIQGVFRPGRVVVAGIEDFHREMGAQVGSDKSGQLLITAHLGSWELLGRSAAQSPHGAFNVLAKPGRNRLITGALAVLRMRMGTPVLWTGSRMVQRPMLRALGRGEWIGFVMDQKPAGRVGPSVNFFGRKTEFVAGPATMAARHGSSLIAAFCVREGPYRYRIICKSLLAPDHNQTDVATITQMCAAEIERMIRLYPEQWCWNYKRWQISTHNDSI